MPYPKVGNFADLLDWHLKFGTRPDGSPTRPGKRWGNKEFADAVLAGAVDPESGSRNVRNWRRGRNLPQHLESVERALFGDNEAYSHWRFDLRAAYDGHEPLLERAGIPRPPEHFLGRATDVATILGAVNSPAPVAILIQGGPGIGKTALTQAVGHHPEVIQRFGKANRWFVPLDTATTAASMRDAITHALGGDRARGFEATLVLLRQRPGLLILDNLETSWDPRTERAATENTLAELAAIPGLILLASFRGRDRVSGPAWALVHSVAHLSPHFSSELFNRVAQQNFADDRHLPHFIAALSGIPLAIELVGRRAHGRTSLAALWEQWRRVGTALAVHPDFDASRLTSLSHSIELSLRSNRLTSAGHRLFRLLGQLPAGLLAEDRDELLGDAGFDAEEALLRIGLAIERDNRLDLLPPIRDHSARHHPVTEQEKDLCSVHYLDLVRIHGPRIGRTGSAEAIARLEPEAANIESALMAVPNSYDFVAVLDAVSGFGNLVTFTHLGKPEALSTLTVVYRTAGNVVGEAWCTETVANIAFARADHSTAQACYEQALQLHREVGDVRHEAYCLYRLGKVAMRDLQYDAAREAIYAALPLFCEIGYVEKQAECLQTLGEIAFDSKATVLDRSGYAQAKEAWEQALLLYRQEGLPLGEAHCLLHLGEIAIESVEWTVAQEAVDEALALYRQLGITSGEANCILSRGEIAVGMATYEAAREAYETARELYRRIGMVSNEARCIARLGDIASIAYAEYAAARVAYETALPLRYAVKKAIKSARQIASKALG